LDRLGLELLDTPWETKDTPLALERAAMSKL